MLRRNDCQKSGRLLPAGMPDGASPRTGSPGVGMGDWMQETTLVQETW